MRAGAQLKWPTSFSCEAWRIFFRCLKHRSQGTRSKTNWRRAKPPSSSISSRCTRLWGEDGRTKQLDEVELNGHTSTRSAVKGKGLKTRSKEWRNAHGSRSSDRHLPRFQRPGY